MRENDPQATQPIPLLPSHKNVTSYPAGALQAEHAPRGRMADVLLPGEDLLHLASPHPVVFAAPIAGLALVAFLSPILLLHLFGVWRNVALVACAVCAGLLAVKLIGQAIYYHAYRVIATSRRVFVLSATPLGRRLTPLTNSGMARATIAQGWLGSLFRFGTIVVPSDDAKPARVMRDIHRPVELYREMQRVAHGVEGGAWQPAIRMTQIP